MKPRVSVIMPTFNSERFVSAAIESVLNQSYKDLELIAVDDGSTDTTPAILRHYANLDSRVQVLRNETNRKAPYSRNRGISVSRGEFLVTFDSDDICAPTRLATQIRRMQDDSRLGVIGSSILLIDQYDQVIGCRRYPESDERLRRNIFKFSPFAAPSTMIRKSSILNAGLYDATLAPCEDIDLWFRIARIAKLGNCPEVLLKYRVHGESATFKTMRKMNAYTFRIRLKAMREYAYPTNLSTLTQLFVIRLLTFALPAEIEFYLFGKVRAIILKAQARSTN